MLQAQRDGIAPAGALDAAVESMLELNRAAADAIRPFEPNAVTDVTGFGLLGHVYELASRSGVRVAHRRRGRCRRFPAALELAAERRADRRRPPQPGVRRPARRERAPTRREALAYDPQTAGGLLVSMPGERGARPRSDARGAGLVAARIGRVEEGSGVVLR